MLSLPLLAAWALAAGQPDTGTSALRVVDWNIHKGKHLDTIVAALKQQDPDVVLMQEVDRDVRRTGGLDIAAELARRLGMNHVFAPAFEELGQSAKGDRPGVDGQAILAKSALRKVRVLRYRQQSHFWKPQGYLPNWAIMQRRQGGRIALVAELDAGGRTVVVYNLHLESRGFGHTREMQLDETLADAKRYPRETPIIIGGDFNCVYGPSRVRQRLESDGFSSCFGDRLVRTHIIFGAIDWLFVRGSAGCEDSKVVRGTGASDHDPVVAKFRLSANAPAPKTF